MNVLNQLELRLQFIMFSLVSESEFNLIESNKHLYLFIQVEGMCLKMFSRTVASLVLASSKKMAQMIPPSPTTIPIATFM